jgi:hypothetical protein
LEPGNVWKAGAALVVEAGHSTVHSLVQNWPAGQTLQTVWQPPSPSNVWKVGGAEVVEAGQVVVHDWMQDLPGGQGGQTVTQPLASVYVLVGAAKARPKKARRATMGNCMLRSLGLSAVVNVRVGLGQNVEQRNQGDALTFQP